MKKIFTSSVRALFSLKKKKTRQQTGGLRIGSDTNDIALSLKSSGKAVF